MNTYNLISLFVQSPEAFIEALREKTGKDFLNPEDVAPYITFTKTDVLAYIQEHHKKNYTQPDIPSSLIRTPGSADGLYLTAVADGFELYNQERGARMSSRKFTGETEVLAVLQSEHRDAVIAEELSLVGSVDRMFAVFGR